jgi:hypothetical protein
MSAQRLLSPGTCLSLIYPNPIRPPLIKVRERLYGRGKSPNGGVLSKPLSVIPGPDYIPLIRNVVERYSSIGIVSANIAYEVPCFREGDSGGRKRSPCVHIDVAWGIHIYPVALSCFHGGEGIFRRVSRWFPSLPNGSRLVWFSPFTIHHPPSALTAGPTRILSDPHEETLPRIGSISMSTQDTLQERTGADTIAAL